MAYEGISVSQYSGMCVCVCVCAQQQHRNPHLRKVSLSSNRQFCVCCFPPRTKIMVIIKQYFIIDTISVSSIICLIAASFFLLRIQSNQTYCLLVSKTKKKKEELKSFPQSTINQLCTKSLCNSEKRRTRCHYGKEKESHPTSLKMPMQGNVHRKEDHDH